MNDSVEKLQTIGEIARQADQSVHRIAYIVKTRAIRPVSRAGKLRIFAPEAVRIIKNELTRIDKRHDRMLPLEEEAHGSH